MKDNQDCKIDTQEIGKRIRMIRYKLNPKQKMSGKEFLQAIRPGEEITDVSCVSKWESGTLPPIDVLASIANLANTTLDWLVLGKGESPAILGNKKESSSPYTLRDICRMLSLLVFACDSDIQVNTQENNKSIIFSIKERKFCEFFTAVSKIYVQMLVEKQDIENTREIIETDKMFAKLGHTQNTDHSLFEDIYKRASKNISDLEDKLSALHICDLNDVEPLNTLLINIFSHLSTLKNLDENESENYYKEKGHVIFSIPGYSLTFSDKPLSNNIQKALDSFCESVPNMTMENYLLDCLGLPE